MAETSSDNWEVEYKEAGECFRLYTTFLINIVKGFTAGNAVLFAALAYLARDGLKTNISTALVSIAGVIGSVAAIVIQRRTYKYWRLFLSRAVEIEKLNGLQLYCVASIHATTGRMRSSAVVLIIYSAFIVFWSIVLLKVFGVTEISLNL